MSFLASSAAHEKESVRDAVLRDDAMAVDEAVGMVAKRFQTYHHSLRPHYVCCYLENVLGLLQFKHGWLCRRIVKRCVHLPVPPAQ